ncbi:hypothetical protein KY284_003793 [Solanum tuberosum]|nr:hypothetical protein KY284_003793 [Solanum tuberosum]
MEKTDKGTTHRKGIPQGAPISPGKDQSARSRPMDRKKDAGKENERRNPNLLWECEIGRRGVRSRTTAGFPAVIAELIRWAAPNLELTFKSEINIGSRLSEKRRLKRKITKCNTTRGSLDRSLREGRS